jgi:SAM-dependent methyltransferase
VSPTLAPSRAETRGAPVSPRCDDLHYSVRRYFVDEFFERHAATLSPGTRVIDVGGFKGKRRGQFDLARFPIDIVCVNSSPAASPDILADAAAIPLPDEDADAVILGEVVEHLWEPERGLREAARLLCPGGVLLATAPFLFRVHEDPIDVGRYAPEWWRRRLEQAGFVEISIEPQGMLFSVLAEFVRGWVKHLADSGTFWPGIEPLALSWTRTLREQALAWERRQTIRESAYYQSFTTGYGVRAVKG